MDKIYDEFLGAKDMTDKELQYQNRSVDREYMAIIEKLKTNFYKPPNLLLVVISKVVHAQTLIMSILNSMPSHHITGISVRWI